MRFYTQQHKYYCGIDLHARSLYVCILDQAGKTLVHRKLACDRAELIKCLKPYRKDLAVAVECLFCWYWWPICVKSRASLSSSAMPST